MEEQTLPLNPLPGASATEAHTQAEVPALSTSELEQRYADTIVALFTEASKSRTVPLLADAIAYQLARIIVDCGAVATGHVLGRLGSYITHFVERERAAAEAKEARNAGRLPH